MRIEVLRRFRDMDALTNPDRTGDDDPVHEAGATITVTKERGEELIARGFASEIAPRATTPNPAASKAAAKRANKPATKKAPAPASPPAPAPPPATPDPASDPAPEAPGN